MPLPVVNRVHVAPVGEGLTGLLDPVLSILETRVLGIPIWLIGVGVLLLVCRSGKESSMGGWDEYEDVEPALEGEYED